jgi:hypothetical protein
MPSELHFPIETRSNLFNMSRKLDLSQFRGEDSDDESGFAPKVTLPSQRPLIPTDRDVASSRTR